jgi:N-acetylmuramoyl-L-alanine amidase
MAIRSSFVLLALFTSMWSPYLQTLHGQHANGALGWQQRFGDEIVVCGQFYRIGAPVKLWMDEGGFDAYRTDRRFSTFEERKWKRTVEAMREGKIDFVSKPQDTAPDRYSMRFESSASEQFSPEQLEHVRGGGWKREWLQEKVDQFVVHFDVCGTSAQCFYVLHDRRGLSVHFMLDVDGTIYQTLDLKERAWHATKSNDRSIGIEVANIGAYAVDGRGQTLKQWYRQDEVGQTYLIFPENIRGREVLEKLRLKPRRNTPVIGKIRDREYQQYDFTQPQYDSLAKLSAALCDIFPKLKPDVPRGPDGSLIDRTLSDEQWASFSGILGHFHIQENKTDPGPAMDWDYLIQETQARLKVIRKGN